MAKYPSTSFTLFTIYPDFNKEDADRNSIKNTSPFYDTGNHGTNTNFTHVNHKVTTR
ncbi:hypothetical protein [Flavobacterium sp. TSSA_36]|uniref:hypothetical protein n=1 Tax=Flavobacterium sp. TSSA_36 TaxID=3447669 RepID=UPI003F34F213